MYVEPVSTVIILKYFWPWVAILRGGKHKPFKIMIYSRQISESASFQYYLINVQ